MTELPGLAGGCALVTGASRGIGAAVAAALAGQGMNLVLVARSGDESLERAAAELASRHGIVAHAVAGDVGDPATATLATRTAFKAFRRLDVTVNNAGVLRDALIGMIDEVSIDETLATNVKGVLNVTQASARLMERGGGGSIINVSSIIGRFGNRGQLVYGASKAAVIGATLSAAKELAPKGIRVNAVAPGYIETDMIRGIDAAVDRARRDSIGMGRIGTPEDIADAVLFFASGLSSYVTGQTLGVDGAMLV